MGTAKIIDQHNERGGASPRYYEVFARRTSADALEHVGSVEAPNDDLARVRAWYVYDQHHWREMCIVRQDSVIAITESDKNIKIKAN